MSKREIYATATTNNDPPSDEMVNGAKEDMSEGLKELARVQSELRKLREQMARLEEDEKAIQQGLDVCSCILSPVRHLPFDVLEEIFLHCLSEDDNHPPTIRDIAQAPLLLMRVCRTWRQICLACPLHWTSLRLDYLDFRAPSAEWEGIFRRIQGWLSRSGQCSIHIVMSSTRGYMRKGDNDNAVVDALLPFMHRCNSLYLSGPEHQPFIDLLSPAALVRLRSVKIEPVVGAGSYLNTWLPLRKLMAAPNLQSFCCISASPSNISITEIPLHLSPHLTHLVLQGAETPYQDVLAALQRLPELRRLGILFRHQSLTDAIVPVEVSLPSLEELIVFDYENPSRTATFLDCLTDLSSLCSLDCQTSSRLAYIVNHTLSQDANKNGFSFAAYSLLAKKIEAKNLRHLGISLNLNSDQVVGCFRMLPYIAKLDLTNCYDSARRKPFPEYFNLEPLIVQPNTPVLLPRLRFISIKNSCRITDEVVLRFIISRIQALSCSNISDGKVAVLRSFEGLFPREKQQEVMSAIKQYGSDTGIEEVPDIKLTYIQA